MPRPRTVPDPEIFAQILTMLSEGGEKMVSFGSVSQSSGLSGSSLAQRYGNRDAMQRAAMEWDWQQAVARLAEAEARTPRNPKGAVELLKTLMGPAPVTLSLSFRDPVLLAAAEEWRAGVIAALTLRLGGARAKDRAALLFSAWQGRQLWQRATGKGFKLKEAVALIGS